MMFLRRNKQSWMARMRDAFWPKRGWARAALYVKMRILRLSANPSAVALGIAAGAAASMTPFVGMHFLIAFAIAFMVGGNMLAAALGTAIGNPVTFPFIWTLSYKIGALVLSGVPSAGDLSRIGAAQLSFSGEMIWPTLKPMIVGAFPVALAVFVITYWVVYRSVLIYRKSRINKPLRRRIGLPNRSTN